MKNRPLRALLVTVASLSVWTVPGFVRPAAAAAAAITLANPDHPCEGEAATLRWDPPADVAGVIGYEITQMIVTDAPTPRTLVTRVPTTPTAVAFTLPYGISTFLIRTVTSSGATRDPFTTAAIVGNRIPSAMTFDLGSGSVGDRSATVPFKWYGPPTMFTTGGQLPVTVTVTGSGPTGTIGPVTVGPIANPTPPNRVAAEFTRLRNGAQYTFGAVTSNACGSSASSRSPIFVPGLPPTWTAEANPPRTVRAKRTYRYKFAAAGVPAPLFQLVEGPTWLTVGPHGFLKGLPPAGTTSFTYTVKATNGVGVWTAGVSPSDIVAGPFTVKVVA